MLVHNTCVVLFVCDVQNSFAFIDLSETWFWLYVTYKTHLFASFDMPISKDVWKRLCVYLLLNLPERRLRNLILAKNFLDKRVQNLYLYLTVLFAWFHDHHFLLWTLQVYISTHCPFMTCKDNNNLLYSSGGIFGKLRNGQRNTALSRYMDTRSANVEIVQEIAIALTQIRVTASGQHHKSFF